MRLTNFACAAVYLGLFLFGLHLMSRSLARAAGPSLRKLLAGAVGTPWKGFLVGGLVTAVLQSSSLTSLMVVGLVNGGMLNLAQAIGVIIGANVGTTITAQLISFNLHRFAPPVVAAGAAFYLLPRFRKAAGPLFGFGLVLLGLGGMAASLAPLQDTALVTGMFRAAGEAPWQGICAGFVTTVALQSSSAVMGLVLGLALEGIISLPAAVAIIVGADLGTCTTALVASLGMNRAARAAAWSHFLFNLVSLFLAALFFPQLVLLAAKTASALPRQLANAHTLYNLLGAVTLLPLAPLLARLFEGLPPPGKKKM